MFALCVDLLITKIDQAVCQLQLRVVATMTGTCCLVCGNSQSKDSDASFHRFPSDLGRRAIWLRVFDFQESDIKPHHRVCSRHFPNGDARSDPIATLGKRFASPIKKGPRAKRAKGRQTKKQLREVCPRNISWGKHQIWSARGYCHGSRCISGTVSSTATVRRAKSVAEDAGELQHG